MSATTTITTGSLAQHLRARGVGAEILGSEDVRLTRFDAADAAGPGAITFFRGERFASHWSSGSASAAFVTKELVKTCLPEGGTPAGARALIVVPSVDLACAAALPLFAPVGEPEPTGIHPTAIVDPRASIAKDAWVGPACVISAGASIGPGSRLVAGCFLGKDAKVGARCTLHPHVRVLDRCEVGNDCILHGGVTLGADGFGYTPGPQGLVKIPHIGNVVIEDHVEIGASSCVDRAKFGSTLIGAGTKIDNLVQIAHNCRIGRSCIICGNCGIAGSVVLGDGVVLGGMVGIADGLEIGAGSRIMAHSAVMADVPPKSDYGGVPAGPARDMKRNYAAFRNLGDTLAEIKRHIRGNGKVE